MAGVTVEACYLDVHGHDEKPEKQEPLTILIKFGQEEWRIGVSPGTSSVYHRPCEFRQSTTRRH